METHPKSNGVEAKQIPPTRNLNLDDEAESFCYAIQMVNSVAVPMSFHAVLELGVLDIIHKAGQGAKLSAKDIAEQILSKNPEAPQMLDRILMLLASYSVLNCSVVADDESGSLKRLYSLNSVSRYYVPNEDGVSLKPLMSLIHDNVFLQNWSQLKEAILEGGIPFNRVHGINAFEYQSSDPRFNKVFNAAMSNSSRMAVKKILESYKGFERINTLVDVGGGIGTTLSFITSKYPHIQGINFDLPHVIKEAPSHHGVKHVGGDMFESVPCGDAIFLKLVLHDWSDELSVKILKNCYDAIPSNGKVIVAEQVLPTTPQTNTSVKATCQTDILMMTVNPGGKERNEQEFMEIATKSGFSGINYACLANDLWVMEFFK